MMLFLPGDVIADGFKGGWADTESSVSFLPMEIAEREGFRDPDGGGFFQLADEIGQTVGGFEIEQKMDMISNSANSLKKASEFPDGPSHVFMESRPPFRAKKGLAMFG